MEIEAVNNKEARQDEKQRVKAIKLKEKIEKFCYSDQIAMLQSMGFTDERLLFKSLKKNKGDLVKAVDFLVCKDSTKKEFKGTPEEGDRIKKGYKRRNEEKEFKGTPEEGERIKKGGKRRNERKEFSSSEEESGEKKQQRKMKRILEQFPQFEAFNQKMILAGHLDFKKNFKALKKTEGNEEKALQHLHLKELLEKIQLKISLSKGEYSRVVIDCNNCFYIEQSFMKKAIKGDFKEIEEKIATLLRLFQNCYGSEVEVVLVFDNSKLMKDNEKSAQFLFENFKMLNAKPQYDTADDLLVDFAGKQSQETLNRSLFVTSDRMLQARLLDKKVSNIIASNQFFKLLKNDFIGLKDYSGVVDV